MAAPLPGVLQFAGLPTSPTAPGVGYAIIYIKTDNVLYIKDSGGVEVALGSSSSITQLTGDVTATGPGIVAATVAFVGGQTAADVASATLLALAATSANTASTIVRRNGSGGFTAGAIVSSALTINTFSTGIVHSDGSGVLSSSLIVNADIDAAAAIAYSKLNLSNSIVNADVNTSAAIAYSKLADLGSTPGNLLVVSASDKVEAHATINVSDLVLTDGSVVFTGDLDLGTNDIINVGLVDGVNVSAHAARHLPSGADPLAYAIPVQVGTSNFIGAAESFALSDHIHSHGAQTSGTLHAAATTSINGFMSAADKTKLDNATSSNTPSTLVLRDGSGDFSASTITASLTGAASANLLKAGDTMTGYFRSATVALTDAANIDTDVSLGNTFTVTLGGNRTLNAPTGMGSSRQKITYIIKQDGTGGRTLTFDPVFRFGLDILSVTLSTGANKTDYIGMIYNSTDSKWDIIAVSKGF